MLRHIPLQFAVSLEDLRTGEQFELPVDGDRHLLSCPAGLDASRMQAVANGRIDFLGEFRFLHMHAVMR